MSVTGATGNRVKGAIRFGETKIIALGRLAGSGFPCHAAAWNSLGNFQRIEK